MKRIWIDSFDINLKSAFRNLKSAILLGAMLFALCLHRPSAAATKVPQIGYLTLVGWHRLVLQAFVQGLRDLATSKGKISPLSSGQREGKIGALHRSRSRTGASESGRHCRGRLGTGPGCKASNEHDPYCHDQEHRPRGNRIRRQPSSAWRQYHRAVNRSAGVKRKTVGAAQGDRSSGSPAWLSRDQQPGSSTEDFFIKETENPARTLKVQMTRVAMRGSEGLRKHLSSRNQRTGSGSCHAYPANAPSPSAQAVRGVRCKASPTRRFTRRLTGSTPAA